MWRWRSRTICRRRCQTSCFRARNPPGPRLRRLLLRLPIPGSRRRTGSRQFVRLRRRPFCQSSPCRRSRRSLRLGIRNPRRQFRPRTFRPGPTSPQCPRWRPFRNRRARFCVRLRRRELAFRSICQHPSRACRSPLRSSSLRPQASSHCNARCGKSRRTNTKLPRLRRWQKLRPRKPPNPRLNPPRRLHLCQRRSRQPAPRLRLHPRFLHACR